MDAVAGARRSVPSNVLGLRFIKSRRRGVVEAVCRGSGKILVRSHGFLSNWCKVFVARCGVLLTSCCGSGQLSNTDVAVSQRVCSCGAVPGQSVQSLEELCRVVYALGNLPKFTRKSRHRARGSLGTWSYKKIIGLGWRTSGGISCRSSCTRVSSLHFQLPRSGREVEKVLGGIH